MVAEIDFEREALVKCAQQTAFGTILPRDARSAPDNDYDGYVMCGYPLGPGWSGRKLPFHIDFSARMFLYDHGFGRDNACYLPTAHYWANELAGSIAIDRLDSTASRLRSGDLWCVPIFPRPFVNPGYGMDAHGKLVLTADTVCQKLNAALATNIDFASAQVRDASSWEDSVRARRDRRDWLTHFVLVFMPIFGFFLPCVAQARGVDCARAVTRIDRAICGNPDLIKQDTLMAKSVSTILAHTATSDLTEQFRSQQKRWIAGRDMACGDASVRCLSTQYQARNLALSILLDRIGTAPLTNIMPVMLVGKWSIPHQVIMLSPADNPLHDNMNVSLDGPDASSTDKQIYFPAHMYAQWGLALPGSMATGISDGSTCFSGPSYDEPGYGGNHGTPSSTVPGNYCVRFGWIKISLDQLLASLPLPTVFGGYPDPDPLDWLESGDIPIFVHDLNIPPNADAYIGFVRQAEDDGPGGLGQPAPTVLFIQGNGGALYAVVPLSTAGQDNTSLTDIGYQKWVPASPDARMLVLSDAGP